MNSDRRHPEIPSFMQPGIPNYRRAFRPSENPNFASPEARRSAETILTTIQEIERLIATTEDELESHYGNLLLRLLIGTKSLLMDEYSLAQHPQWHSETSALPGDFERKRLNLAALDQFQKGLAEWGIELTGRGIEDLK